MNQSFNWNPGEHYRPNPNYNPMFKDRPGFLRDLGLAIRGEAEAIAYYTALLKIAPNPLAERNIEHILNDEKEHFQMFTELNYRLTGRKINVPIPQPPNLTNYPDALIQAFEDELEAVALYKAMYLNALTLPIRDTMFYIMMDEMEHADRLSLLYANYS